MPTSHAADATTHANIITSYAADATTHANVSSPGTHFLRTPRLTRLPATRHVQETTWALAHGSAPSCLLPERRQQGHARQDAARMSTQTISKSRASVQTDRGLKGLPRRGCEKKAYRSISPSTS